MKSGRKFENTENTKVQFTWIWKVMVLGVLAIKKLTKDKTMVFDGTQVWEAEKRVCGRKVCCMGLKWKKAMLEAREQWKNTTRRDNHNDGYFYFYSSSLLILNLSNSYEKGLVNIHIILKFIKWYLFFLQKFNSHLKYLNSKWS